MLEDLSKFAAEIASQGDFLKEENEMFQSKVRDVNSRLLKKTEELMNTFKNVSR
jgi:hypothetical protein